jgi:hypothetical protein
LLQQKQSLFEIQQYHGKSYNILQIQNEKKIKIGVVLVGVLLEMLKFKQFYPTPSWVVPFKNSSMEYLKLQSLWKCMMMSPSLELDDVARIFYEHTNPSLS